jgi:iron complex outermembrane recepter protein
MQNAIQLGIVRALLLASTAITIAGTAAEAHAQTAPETPSTGPAANQGDASSGIQNIIVTARRRAESAQKVPVAVSVVSSQMLEQHQVVDACRLVNLTPSLQVQSANQQVGATNFTIRGIGTNVFGPAEASVGVVIDDVAMARPLLGIVQFFDLDRVEVLRGPQGMLFGKNASAGLVNISTADPRLNESQLIANIQYGNTTAPGSGHQITAQTAFNTPVSTDSALRVSAFFTRQDGYTVNIKRDEDSGLTQFGGRIKYLWQPSDALKVILTGDYQHEKGPGESVLVRSYAAPGGLIDALNAADGIVAGPKNTRVANDVSTENDFDVGGTSLRAMLDIGDGFALTNVAAWRFYKSHTQVDTDTTSADIFNTNAGGRSMNQYSEELRLTSPDDQPLTYQLGLFYLHFRDSSTLLQGGNLGVPVPAGTNLLGGLLQGVTKTDSYAAFFEGTYRITDRFRVTGGGRYSHDKLNYTMDFGNPLGLIPLYPFPDVQSRVSSSNFSYRAGLDFDIATSVLTYFTYARGYKQPTVDALTGRRVDAEIPKSFEVGIKSTLLDRKLRLNLALFDTTFDNFQTQAQLPGTAAGFSTLNAGKLKSRGVEVEYTLLPFEGLTLSGGTTYNFTEYRNLSGIPC